MALFSRYELCYAVFKSVVCNNFGHYIPAHFLSLSTYLPSTRGDFHLKFCSALWTSSGSGITTYIQPLNICMVGIRVRW